MKDIALAFINHLSRREKGGGGLWRGLGFGGEGGMGTQPTLPPIFSAMGTAHTKDHTYTEHCVQLGHLGARLFGLTVQSLIGSPCTLCTTNED